MSFHICPLTLRFRTSDILTDDIFCRGPSPSPSAVVGGNCLSKVVAVENETKRPSFLMDNLEYLKTAAVQLATVQLTIEEEVLRRILLREALVVSRNSALANIFTLPSSRVYEPIEAPSC